MVSTCNLYEPLYRKIFFQILSLTLGTRTAYFCLQDLLLLVYHQQLELFLQQRPLSCYKSCSHYCSRVMMRKPTGWTWYDAAHGIPESHSDLVKDLTTFSTLGRILRWGIRADISSYAIWFWFRGNTELMPKGSSCQEYIFLFTKITIDGGGRKFY